VVCARREFEGFINFGDELFAALLRVARLFGGGGREKSSRGRRDGRRPAGGEMLRYGIRLLSGGHQSEASPSQPRLDQVTYSISRRPFLSCKTTHPPKDRSEYVTQAREVVENDRKLSGRFPEFVAKLGNGL